jgi:hypothetical protein
LIDRAIAECSTQQSLLARVKGLEHPLLVAFGEDEITGTGATVHKIVVGVCLGANNSITVLRDWEALLKMNDFYPSSEKTAPLLPSEISAIRILVNGLVDVASTLTLPFKRPKLTPVLVFLPEVQISS